MPSIRMEPKQNASKRMDNLHSHYLAGARPRKYQAAGIYSNWQGGVNVILCDLCGNQKECFQKEIDGREFDICADCWRALEEKLRGKGRSKRTREVVFLPPPFTPEP